MAGCCRKAMDGGGAANCVPVRGAARPVSLRDESGMPEVARHAGRAERRSGVSRRASCTPNGCATNALRAAAARLACWQTACTVLGWTPLEIVTRKLRRTGAAMTRALRYALFIAAVMLTPAVLQAQDGGDRSSEKTDGKTNGDDGGKEKEEERTTGLPSQIKWVMNIDAGWGNFGFANSLFTNPKEPGVDENLSDQWFEGYVKPALTATYTLDSSSVLYGKISVV